MSNEKLKKKFENHFGRSSVGLIKDDAWNWIEENCLPKQEDKILSIKKHINDCLEHYQALDRLGQLMEYENTCNDVYKSILNKIVEIESNSK